MHDIFNCRFDDFLFYLLSRKIGFHSGLRGLGVDELFFEKVFGVYNLTLNKEVVFFDSDGDDRFTLAVAFIVLYSAISTSNITFLCQPKEQYRNAIINVFKTFKEVAIDFETEIASGGNNEFVFSIDGRSCEVAFKNDMSYALKDVKGLVVFDGCRPLKNHQKMSSLLLNKAAYDKILINFPINEELAKLAVDYELKINKIKLA